MAVKKILLLLMIATWSVILVLAAVGGWYAWSEAQQAAKELSPEKQREEAKRKVREALDTEKPVEGVTIYRDRLSSTRERHTGSEEGRLHVAKPTDACAATFPDRGRAHRACVELVDAARRVPPEDAFDVAQGVSIACGAVLPSGSAEWERCIRGSTDVMGELGLIPGQGR